ncbi:MAG: bL17 family ribosomal protein [Pirellulales bacterium]
MRHRRLGRKLGRSPTHQHALLRNLASALFLTERDTEGEENEPKVKGRIVTTLPKAKEVRPLVEKSITLACRGLAAMDAAAEFGTDTDRDSEAWRTWRKSENWRKWANAMAPAVAARRKAIQMLGDKKAVRVLFDTVAPRFRDRKGGYTRILKLAKPRLGDAGDRAIIEFVGRNDRVTTKSEAPSFDDQAKS